MGPWLIVEPGLVVEPELIVGSFIHEAWVAQLCMGPGLVLD